MALSTVTWYSDPSLPAEPPLALAQAAFDQALAELHKHSAKDARKHQLLQNIYGAQWTSLGDVIAAVASAQEHYARKHAGSKASEALTAFSKRVGYYGNIMDVLVSHHPEYVALAWGAFKLLFGAVAEHEHVGTTIVTGLCSIADALPRTQLVASLYPTTMMKQLVAKLYAGIVRFLVRALGWYEEGKLARALHSITRPAALYYDDILDDIRRTTRSITDLAAASSQAEQRDMHERLHAMQRDVRLALQMSQATQESVDHKLNLLNDALQQLRVTAFLNRPVEATLSMPAQPSAPDMNVSHVLAIVSSGSLVDHRESYRIALILRNRRFRSRAKRPKSWSSPELLSWSRVQHSSSIHLQSTFRNRHVLEDFGVSIIEYLLKSNIGVLWGLSGKRPGVSAQELLKSLIYQALVLCRATHSDIVFTHQLRKFLDAVSAKDYVYILAEILQHFKLIYIIIDAAALDLPLDEKFGGFVQMLLRLLTEKRYGTIIKTMNISYGPVKHTSAPSSNAIVRVPKPSRRKRQGIHIQPL